MSTTSSEPPQALRPCSGSIPGRRRGSGRDLRARAGSHATAAIEVHGIGWTIFQSSVGAEKRHGAGEIDGLARTEEALDATTGAVVHLRCGFFYSNLLLQLTAIEAGLIEVASPIDQEVPWVDPRDIGDVAASRLLNRGLGGQAGPGRTRPRAPELEASGGDRQRRKQLHSAG